MTTYKNKVLIHTTAWEGFKVLSQVKEARNQGVNTTNAASRLDTFWETRQFPLYQYNIEIGYILTNKDH